ncbi:uncharacterized protein LOC125370975 [Ricinus communis]|uniref:uncharacterized protein LOC125370975 n=1 Tax=Ricinus communis TaxID=3988 RepID=UPI00201AABF5|nr:uncharacterized protein LOC125370975 [Ricinus communis]
MEMILRHEGIRREQRRPHFDVPSEFLEAFSSDHQCCDNKLQSPTPSGKYVLVPDGLHCSTCYSIHGYPSHEQTERESEDFLQLLEHCTCFCAYIELPRHWLVMFNDYLNQYFDKLDRKYNSLEEMMLKNQELQERSWRLVREIETEKESCSVDPVFQKLLEMPEGILEDCKIWFPEILNFLHENRLGFCQGDVNLLLNYLSQAYSLVHCKYCSISRMAI